VSTVIDKRYPDSSRGCGYDPVIGLSGRMCVLRRVVGMFRVLVVVLSVVVVVVGGVLGLLFGEWGEGGGVAVLSRVLGGVRCRIRE